MVHERAHVSFVNAFLVEEILTRKQVISHLSCLLHEGLFLVLEITGYLLLCNACWPQRKLVLHEAALLIRSRMGLDVVFAHPAEKLSGKLHQDLFS